MQQFPVMGGNVAITDNMIQLNLSVIGGFKRFYEERKILFIGFVAVVFAYLLLALLDHPLFRTLVVFGCTFLLLLVTFGYVKQKFFQPNTTTDTEIPRNAIERVVYTDTSRITGPKFSIIYRKDGERKVTSDIQIYPRWFTKEDGLERAIAAFDSEGIETQSTDEVT